jgi:hypothetical protein
VLDTLVRTGVFVVVPFRNGTVSKGPTVPGLLGLVQRIDPPLLVVVLPEPLKANLAGGALFGEFDVVSTATVTRLGLDDPGVMPVTDPLFTPVIAVPVVFGLRAALVKNGTAPVVTPFTAGAIVTPVTTVPPGCPLMSFTALAKVWFTPVTHVSADAEDTSAVLRLPTVSAARSVWFEADANSASRTAARRGIMVRFRLAIRASSELVQNAGLQPHIRSNLLGLL